MKLFPLLGALAFTLLFLTLLPIAHLVLPLAFADLFQASGCIISSVTVICGLSYLLEN